MGVRVPCGCGREGCLADVDEKDLAAEAHYMRQYYDADSYCWRDREKVLPSREWYATLKCMNTARERLAAGEKAARERHA